MHLNDLGYYEAIDHYRDQHDLGSFDIARVLAEHKERYVIQTSQLELEAEITGNLRFSAKERTDFPAVGDWVAVSVFDDQMAIIHQVLPRKSMLRRRAVGKFGEQQIIATNIDYAFIVMAVDRDYNLNRLERYLALCYDGDVTPILLLSKIDLIPGEALQSKEQKIKQGHPSMRVIPFSNTTRQGHTEIKSLIQPGRTYCVIGSSGVGKSTLTNWLTGKDLVKTGAISESTQKGKHVTSHRELFMLDQGGLLIDTPGMREVGIMENVEKAFDTIQALSGQCKYNNCTHTQEDGCAILEALEEGMITPEAYGNYIKMQREAERIQASIVEKRKKDRAFGKMYKEFKKHNKREG